MLYFVPIFDIIEVSFQYLFALDILRVSSIAMNSNHDDLS